MGPHLALLDENGMLELAIGGFLIRSAERVAIVDAGVGQSPLPLLICGAFLESLASHGVTPDEVTDVIFTHLHFDHIGWASRDGVPVFPNATYRCDARDWEYFVDPPAELSAQPVDEDNPLAHWLHPEAAGRSSNPWPTVSTPGTRTARCCPDSTCAWRRGTPRGAA